MLGYGWMTHLTMWSKTLDLGCVSNVRLKVLVKPFSGIAFSRQTMVPDLLKHAKVLTRLTMVERQ